MIEALFGMFLVFCLLIWYTYIVEKFNGYIDESEEEENEEKC